MGDALKIIIVVGCLKYMDRVMIFNKLGRRKNPHPNPTSATVAGSPADSPQAMEGTDAGNMIRI